MDAKWLKAEYDMHSADKVKKVLKRLEKDPATIQAQATLDQCSLRLHEAKLTARLLETTPERLGVTDPDEVLQRLGEVHQQIGKLNQEINRVLGSDEIQRLTGARTNAVGAAALRNGRGDHLLAGSENLRSTVDAGASLAINAAKAGTIAADAGTAAVSTLGMVGGAVAIPMGAARAVTGTATSVREGMKAYQAYQAKKNAAEARLDLTTADDALLAAIAKRVEGKQARNQVHHVAASVAGASAAVAGAATVVSGTAATIAGGMGAASFGAGAAPMGVVATVTGVVAGGAGVVAVGASASVVAYDIARHANSQAKKESVKTADAALKKLESGGYTELPNLTKSGDKALKDAFKQELEDSKDNYLVGKLKNRVNNGLDGNQSVLRTGMKSSQAASEIAQAFKETGNALRKLPPPTEIMASFRNTEVKNPVCRGTLLLAGGATCFLAVNGRVTGACMEAVGKLTKPIHDTANAALKVVHDKLNDFYVERKRGIVLDPSNAHQGDSVRAKMKSAREATLSTTEVKAILALQKFAEKHGLSPQGDQALDKLSIKEMQKNCGIKKVTRDSSAAAEAFCERLKADCLAHAPERTGVGIIASDLPEDAASIKLARKLGMKDAEIVNVVNSQLHANERVQKAGKEALRTHIKMK